MDDIGTIVKCNGEKKEIVNNSRIRDKLGHAAPSSGVAVLDPVEGTDRGEFGRIPLPSNRGIETPLNRISSEYKGVDFITQTVWGCREILNELIEDYIVDRHYAADFEGWSDRPNSNCRVENTEGIVIHGKEVLRVGDYKGQPGMLRLEIKGSACDSMDDVGLAGWFKTVKENFDRSQFSRVDFAFDGLQVTPKEVFDHIGNGEYRSRCSIEKQWLENKLGGTCYSTPSRGGDRFIVVYEMRGFTRYEQRHFKQHAKGIGGCLTYTDPEKWGQMAAASARDYLEFVDVSSSSRLERCKLLPWYHEAFGGVPKKSFRAKDEKPDSEAIQKVAGALQRSARRLEQGMRAFGVEWLVAELEREAGKRWDETDEAAVAALKRGRGYYAKHGVLGVPQWPASSDDDCPF